MNRDHCANYGQERSRDLRARLADLTGAKPATLDRICAEFPHGRGLGTATIPQLRAMGATDRQASRIVAAFGLVRGIDESTARDGRASLRHPTAVVAMLRARGLADSEQESFWVLALDSRQRVIDMFEIGRGSLSQVDVHPRELFKPLIRMSAHAAIIAHNHPSDDVEPSDADHELTRRICEVGQLVGIPVLDHVIVTRSGSCSFASIGALP